MAHKVLVLSPMSNMGTTCVATFIAQALTYSNKTSMLVFTEKDSLLPHYVGIEDVNDPTRSVMQIVRLIDSGSINDNDIIDYAHSMSKNAHLLNLSDKSLKDSDRVQVVNHVYNRVSTNVTLCDCSEDLGTKFSKTLIEFSDQIFIVIDPSIKSAQKLKLWLQHPSLLGNPNVYVVINRYNEVIDSARNLAKYLGMPANRVCKVHYNPWVAKCSRSGSLTDIIPLAHEMDPRVVNLRNDMDELTQCIDGAIIMKNKKGL